jgi:hypothetical protein
METQKQPIRKLELKKKTISKLGSKQVNSFGGDSWTISYATIGCGSDFTRVTRTIVLPSGW